MPNGNHEDDGGPDGVRRWPTGDRDSFVLGGMQGEYQPDEKLSLFLPREGRQSRSDGSVLLGDGTPLSRPRRWHKFLERVGILHPGEGVTHLGRLGRMLREAQGPGGMRRLIASEALQVLRRYQFRNPAEKLPIPADCRVHPYWVVLKAASALDWKLHWDEMNRELMRIMNDDQVDAAIARIAAARQTGGYEEFVGGLQDGPGCGLQGRTWPAQADAVGGAQAVPAPQPELWDEAAEQAPQPAGAGQPLPRPPRSLQGQMRDQRMTPFLKLAGFGDLLLQSQSQGWWSVPEDVRLVVRSAVADTPPVMDVHTKEEWGAWYLEGVRPGDEAPADEPEPPPPPPPQVVVPVSELTVEALKASIAARDPGLLFSDRLLGELVTALRAGAGRNFVILRGVSGTGKSRLVPAVAKAVYGIDEVPEPWLTMAEVRPDWTDGSPLLGYYDPVAQGYVTKPFLQAMLAASRSGQPTFVCLDEMNLAKVEHYLAEGLSAMESGRPIALDGRGNPDMPASVRWPSSLFLFGTVNIDESTHHISDKVLDRAQVIDTSDIELAPRIDALLAVSNLTAEEKATVRKAVLGMWEALRPLGRHFGFRTGEAMVRFAVEARRGAAEVLSVEQAMEAQMRQKVLVRLSGTGDDWNAPLDRLRQVAEDLVKGGPASRLLDAMLADLERLGSFRSWN